MYELNTQEVQIVAAGTLFYITEEWKESQANLTGLVYGTIFGLLGGIGGSGVASLPGTVLGGLAGGTLGYYVGYGISRLDNSLLENNTWYDIRYDYVYY